MNILSLDFDATFSTMVFSSQIDSRISCVHDCKRRRTQLESRKTCGSCERKWVAKQSAVKSLPGFE